MLNGTELLIDACIDRVRRAYDRTYGILEPDYPNILAWAGQMALENVARTDALYHDVDHTVMVTLVGQEILKGRHLNQGGVTPRDWLHFVISLLCHDIGYVRGVCREDREAEATTGVDGKLVKVPRGATDAYLTPYHVDRGKLFVRDRFAGHPIIDAEVLARNIELTRFPVPASDDHARTDDYPGLVRAADLLGQLANPSYLRKLPALFHEFEENGTNALLGYKDPDDLRRDYPRFYWKIVRPFVKDGVRYLRITQEGRQWIANLHAHVFTIEHEQG